MRGYSADKPWRDILPRLSFLEPLFDEKDVLEIGCGDGTSATLICEMGANSVIGLEKPGRELEKALSKQTENLRFDQWMENRFDFADASFDIVIAFEISHQLPLLPEIKRILKEDGFLITSWNHPGYRNIGDCILAPSLPQSSPLEELQQELERFFPQITQIDQIPFYGFSFTPLAEVEQEDERPLEMDSDLFLSQTETPAATLLLCGLATLEFDYHSLVQMPFSPIQEKLITTHQQQQDDQKHSHHKEVAKLRQQYEELRGSVENRNQIQKQDKQHIQRLEVSCAEREEKLSEAQSSCEQLQTKLGKETSERAQLQTSLHLLESRLQEGRESLARASQTNSTQKVQLEEKESWIGALRSETEKLEESLKERESQINEYKKNVADLRREQQTLRQKREACQKQMLAYKQELILLRQQNHQLEKTTQNAQHTIDELEMQLEQEKNTQLLQTQEKSVLQGQSRSLSDQVRTKESLLVQANQNLEQLGHKLESVTAQYAALDQKHLSLITKRESADKQLTSLLTEKESRTEEIHSLQSKLEKTKTTTRELRSQFDQQNKQRLELEKRLQGKEQLYQELQNDLVDTVNQLQNEKSRDHDRQQKLHQTQEALSLKDQQLADLNEKIEELTHELFASRRTEEKRTSTLEQLRTQLAEKEKTTEQLTSEINHLKLGENDSIRELEQECTRLEHSRKNAKKRIADLELDLQQADRTAKHMQSEANHLGLELEKTQGHLAEVLDRLHTTEQIRQKASELERELTWLSSDKDRLGAQHQQQKQTIEKQKSQIAQKQKESDNHREEKERLDKTLWEAKITEGKLQKLLDDSHQQNKTHQIQIEKRTQEAELAQKAQAQLEQQLQQSEQVIKEKEQQLDDIQAQFNQLSEINTKREHDLRQLQEQLLPEVSQENKHCDQDHPDSLQSLRVQIDTFRHKTSLELTSLGEQIRRKDKQLASMTEQLAEMDQQRSWWESRSTDLEQELQHARAQHQQYREQKEQQEQENQDRLTWQLSQERNTNKRREKEIQDLNQHVRGLVKQKQDDLARISAEMKGAQRRIGELESELLQTRTRHQEVLQHTKQIELDRVALQTELDDRQQLISRLNRQLLDGSDSS